MVLGKLPVPGRPTILITVGQGPIALAVGAAGVVWTFLLSSIFSLLSPALWETARYRLKYCLKGSLNPKQPTNQPIISDAISYPLYNLNTLWNISTVLHSYGQVVRRCWVNFQYRGVLLTWITIGQGPIVLAVGAGGVVRTFFLSSIFFLFFLPLFGRRPDID